MAPRIVSWVPVVKLLIVDDSSAVYRRLIELLGGVENLTALAVARTLHEAREKCRSFKPDAVVLDLELPDGSGLEAIASLKSAASPPCVCIFSNRAECRDQALALGADAFYDKSLEFESLVSMLRSFTLAGGLKHA